MDKTIGKWLSLLLLMFCAGNAAFAQKLTAEDFSIKAGESKAVTIVYEGTQEMHGFQTDITLSEGLSCEEVPIGIAIDFLCNSNEQGTNVYRVAGYSESGTTASNGDGIIALTVKASDDFTGGTIKLTHTEISFEGDNAVNPEDLTINVTLESESSDEAKYALFTGEIEPGDYIIFYGGKAMNNTIASNRLQYEEVTPVENVIVNPSADIVWTIAADGDYYTLYNAAAESYAASNGTRNQAALATVVDDNARWAVSGSDTYEFVNKFNNANSVNANLRNNGTYGFACYGTGTGGALYLFKKVAEGEVVKPVLTESQNFDSSLTVEITAEDGADIYYTTDGTEPTESSTKYAEPFDVTETTTVNAIAVKDGVSSEVATATYTLVEPILISEAQELDANSDAFIIGVCVASAASGAVLYDGSDYIYYYNNANDLEIGKTYSVSGTLSTYGGANQFTATADVKEHAPADLIIPTEATELDSDHFEAVVADAVSPRQLATFEGTLTIDGNYYNISIEGTETAMGSLVKPKEDISELNGKKVTVTGYEMYVRNKYVYFVATEVKEAPSVAEGIYYLYDETSKKFMSRGATWGTRAVVDNYGLAIELVLADGAYKLKTVDGQAFYGDDGDMYTDCTGNRERSFFIAQEGEGYTFTNTSTSNPVFVTEEGFINNGEGTATVWKLLTQSERDDIVENRENAERIAALESAGIPLNTPESHISYDEPVSLTFKTGSAWTFTPEERRGATVATNEYGSEVFQGSGTFNQKVEGLEKGLYKVTVQAFYRDGANETVAAIYDRGYNLSLAYLDANGSTAQVPSWGEDRISNTEPNGMSTAADCFADGKYINETYAFVGDDGVLDLTLYQPNFIGAGWFMANEVTYAKTIVEESNLFAVTVDEEIENGTVTVSPTEAEEGETITVTPAPAENAKIDEVFAAYLEMTTDPETGEVEAEMKELEVTAAEDGTFTFVMPAADVEVSATFKTKNEPGTYQDTPLTQDMFKGWDGFDDYAKVNNETPYWDAPALPVALASGQTVYGSGNVANADYADVTGAETLRINGTPGMQFRVLMNRQADNSLIELNPVIGDEGYVDVDLTPYDYVHINAIKTGWGSPTGTIESLILNPSEDEDIEGENWTFDVNPEDVITVTTQGYERNIVEGSDQIAGMQPVTGWTPGVQTESDPGYTGGIFAYGSENFLNNKTVAPASAPEGSESPSALGLAAVWGGVAQYTQPITLPEGQYKFTYTVYNGANTGAVTKNLFGFIAADGTEYLSDKTTFTLGGWETVEVVFSLDAETEGNLSVGFVGAGGSSNAPHLFVDNIDLEQIDEAEVAKDELEKAIAAAEAKNYVIGDDLFQYPQSEIDPLDEAIAEANEVLLDPDATVEEVEKATEDLNNFLETFDPAYNEPVEGQPYIMALTTSEGQFPLAIDGNTNKIVDPEEGDATEIFFEKQDDGTWGMKTEDGDYIAYEGSNNWTMSTSTEPYGWTITALEGGGCSIQGKNGLYGTNTSDGNAANSPIYGDKTPNNGNYIWNIESAEVPGGEVYEGVLTQTLTHPAAGEMGQEVDDDYTIAISEPNPNGLVQIQYVGGFKFPVMPITFDDLVVEAQRTVNDDGSITYSNPDFEFQTQSGMMIVTYKASLTGTQENEDATPTITLVLTSSTTNTVVFGPKEDVYNITVEEAENGTVVSDKDKAKEGETITLTVTPDEGYMLESIAAYYEPAAPVIDDDDPTVGPNGIAPRKVGEQVDVPLTKVDDSTYTFTMPAGDVTVVPVFSISTGINGVNAGFAATLNDALRNGKVFDVSGRRVSNVVKSGVYIVDGKKVMIRK